MVYFKKQPNESVWIRRENLLTESESYKIDLQKNGILYKSLGPLENISTDNKFYVFEMDTTELEDGQYQANIIDDALSVVDVALVQIGELEAVTDEYNKRDEVFEYNPD